MAKKDRPDVVDGEFTKWFWQDVAAAEAQARRVAEGLPKCSKCQRPLWCIQPGVHYVCSGEVK